MPDNINEKIKEQYDHDNSGGSLNTNLGDFLDSESASGDSINTQWRNWAEGTGTSLNTRLFHKHGGSGSFMTRWKNWIAFSSTHSFNFDGSNDYLEFEDEFVFSGAFTVSFWVKHNSSGAEYVLGKASGDQDYFYVHPTSPRWRIANNLILSDTDMAVGVWHHVLAVRDSSDNFIWYLNGSLATVYNGSSYVTTGVTRSGDFDVKYLGRSLNIYGEIQLDEVAFWDTALSASDVTSIYNNGKVIDLSKSASYGTDRTGNLKLWLRCGDKAEPESTTAIARQDFYLDFDGTDDYVSVADDDDLSFGIGSADTPFSISAWINPVDATGFPIISKGIYNTSAEYIFWINLGNTLSFELYDESVSNTYELAYYNSSLASYEGSWFHVCATYDGRGGTSANAGIKLYINGENVSTTLSGAGTYVAMENLGADAHIGRYDSYYADGKISNLAIHQTALDAQTISQMAKSRFIPVRDNRFSVVDFDGSNDYIDCGTGLGTSLGDDYAGSLTVSLWFKADVTSGNDGLFNIGSFSNTQGEFSITLESNILRFKLNAVSWNINHTSFTSTDWNHVVCVYSVGNESNSKMYLNGVSVGTASGTFPSASDMDFSGLKTIIGAYYSSGYPFDGSISSLAVYNVAKSAEEIYAIYQQGITYDESSLSGLVGYWRMGDDTSKAYPTIADSSSNSNDGTITNGASDDIAQQMVAGYDLGAFDSSSEELIQRVLNSDFSNGDTNWTLSSASVVNSVLDVNVGNYTYFVTQSSINQFLANKLYKIEIDITEYTSGTFILYATSTNIASGVSGASTHTFYYQNDASDKYIRLFSQGSGFDGKINSISVKEVLQSEVSDTYPALIDVTEPVLGVDLVDNLTTSGFADNGDGSTISNITGGVSIADDSGASDMAWFRDSYLLSSDLSVGKTYKVQFNAYRNSSGTPQIRVRDGASNTDISITETDTTYTHYMVAQHATDASIRSINNSSGSIVYLTNLSLEELQGNVGTMTNQDSADLVYSSVLPDQSFLTGVNSAYNFIDLDGSNEYIDCGDGTSLDTVSQRTFSMWFKRDGTTTDFLASRDDGGSNRMWSLYIYANVLSYDFKLTGNVGKFTAGSATISADTWYHVLWTNDGTNQVLYLNGSVDGTSSHAGTMQNADISLYLGRRVSSYFNGKIGQTAMWNKALSATEVSAIYTLGRHGNLLDSYSDNLVGYWAIGALDAKTGLSDVGDGTIYDRSGNSNHGTATNTESADLKSSPNAEPNGYSKNETNRTTTTP